MRRPWVFVLVGAASVVAAVPSYAQRTTGAVIGTVTDDSGAVLPGVTIELQGPAIVGIQSAVTNERGFYRFPALPPGAYDLEFKMQGFVNLHQHGLRVSVGGTAEQNVSLKISQLQEEVTVSAEAPVIDTTGNEVSTNYNKEWVRNAPQRRFTFFDLINSAPGVSQTSWSGERSTSLGSSSDENSYQLDGTDFTAPLTGAAWPWPNTDAIEEIEVLSLGAPAEYGNVSGAVFNVVTRQGSNEFHGDANFYFQSQDLTGRNTSDAQDGGLPYNRDEFKDATFQVSGPIAKDKLWFFGSYQYQRDSESQPGTDPAFPARSEADRVFFKLNWQMGRKHKLMFAYHDDYYRIPERATAEVAPSAVSVESGHNPSPNVTYTAILSDKTYVEARYSGFYGQDHADPLNGGPRVNPRFYNLDTGQVTGGIYYWYDGESTKTGFNAKLSHFADDFLGGSHDFKFGVQYNQGGSSYTYGYNDYIYTYEYEGVEYGYGYTRVPWRSGGRMRNVGVFADDSFRVNDRLTVNLGLRYDWNKAYVPDYPILDAQGNDTGQVAPGIDKLYTWNSVSPRIGFNLKFNREGRTVLKGHYGRYYRGIVTGEVGAIGNSVAPWYLGSWNFGLEHQLANDIGLAVTYTHKRGRNYPAWQDTGGVYAQVPYVDDVGAEASGRTISVFQIQNDASERFFLLTNPSGMETRTNAVTAQLTKRMSNSWQATVSYTYLDTKGRIASSLSGLTTSQFGAVFGSFGRNPNDFVNTYGKLIGERPHAFRVQAVWELPAGFLIGANYTWQSGRPWARQVRISDLTGITTTILAEPLDGSRRVSNWNVLDLRFQKEFRLGEQVNVAVFGDLLNTFNDDATEDVESRLGTADNFGVPSRYLPPRRLMLGAKLRF
jgi:outer membrane receptor protein involved in Fe transport